MKRLLTILATLTAVLSGCNGGQWTQLIGQEYPFPPKRVVKGAIAFTITGTAIDELTASIPELLPALLPTNALGWPCLQLDDVLSTDSSLLPEAPAPFTDIGLRQLHVCMDLSKLTVELVEKSDPAQLRLSIEHARLSFEEPAVVFGGIDLGISADAACVIDNQLELSNVPYAADVSFAAQLTLGVDEDGGLALETTLESLTIHELGVEIATDCSLPECSDPNLGDPCFECSICGTANLSTNLFEFLNELLGELLAPALTAVFNTLTEVLLEQSINGNPFSVSAGLSIANALGAITDSGRTASDLGLLIRPAPQGFNVSGDSTLPALSARLEAGTHSEPIHPCVVAEGSELDPPTDAGPYPVFPTTLSNGSPYDLGLAISETFLNQSIWSLYQGGGLCLAITTREISELTQGELVLDAQTLDILFPGVASLAGGTSSVRMVIRPNIRTELLPILRVVDTDFSMQFSMEDLEIGLEVSVNNDYLRLATIRTSATLSLGLTAGSDETLEIMFGDLSVENLSATGLYSSEPAALEAIASLAVEILVQALSASEPLQLALTPPDLSGLLGLDIPVLPTLVQVGALGPDKDWLGIFLSLDWDPSPQSGASKPGTHTLGRRLSELLTRERTVRPPSTQPAATQTHPQSPVRMHQGGCSASTERPALPAGAWILLLLILLRWKQPRWIVLALLGALSCGESEPAYVPCTVRADCPVGYTCDPAQNRCIGEQACESDSDCCLGLTCFRGTCRDLSTCSTDSDCLGLDQICENEQCISTPCAVHEDCSQGLHCIGWRCTEAPGCGGCDETEVCEPAYGRCLPASAACKATLCPEGETRVVVNYSQLRGFSCDLGQSVCACTRLPPIAPPQPGAWPTLVTTSTAQRIIARDDRYGDLLLLDANANSDATPVLFIAGVPNGPVTGDPDGPRGGIQEPGTDIGQHAAAVGFENRIAVVAQDLSQGTLRFFSLEEDTVKASYDLDTDVTAGYGAAMDHTPTGSLHVSYIVHTPDGSEHVRHAYTSSYPTEATDWLFYPVDAGPNITAYEQPCAGMCSPLSLCIESADGPSCGQPDLIAVCDPPCHRGKLCIGGSCQRVIPRAASSHPWHDEPGSQTAIALQGTTALIAWHDHPRGAVRLAVAAGQGSYELGILDGGDGGDPGHHIAIDALPGGPILIAYQDETRSRLKILHGSTPWNLSPEVIEPGGKGIDVVLRDDGLVVIAHGTTSGDRVRALWGTPGQWKHSDAASGDSVGRFNSSVLNGNVLTIATVRDQLIRLGELAPTLELITVVLEE